MPENPRAFPHEDSDGTRVERGLTMRDYFAAKALAGIVSGAARNHYGAELPRPVQTAADAYEFADAMLAEREK